MCPNATIDYVALMELTDFVENGSRHFLPNLSLDMVIIGFKAEKLKCLLLRMGDKWLLPGGHIMRSESVDEAAFRMLKQRTAIENPHLRFVSVFGGQDRSFPEEFRRVFEKLGLPWRKEGWLNDRFVTLAYYSLVDIDKTQPEVGFLDDAFGWFDFDEIPPMWLDHESIVRAARKKLKEDVRQTQFSYRLLPEEFTMPELHRLHEYILEEKLDRSRFQKKMLSTGIFERLPQRKNETPGRNPYQYRVGVDVG